MDVCNRKHGCLDRCSDLVYRESFQNVNERDRRTLIRERLGMLINDGRTYLSPDAGRYQMQIEEWDKRAVGELLKLLGAGYVGRFNCGPAYQVSVPPNVPEGIDREMWYHLKTRLIQLEKIIEEHREPSK